MLRKTMLTYILLAVPALVLIYVQVKWESFAKAFLLMQVCCHPHCCMCCSTNQSMLHL
jgi:hypothetical protein